MSMYPNSFSSVLLGVLCGTILYLFFTRIQHKRLPPGPKPLPIIGHLLQIPTKREYDTYAQWGREYGDVVRVSAVGRHIIILNSITAAKDLLEQRSTIYSDRPYLPMIHEPKL